MVETWWRGFRVYGREIVETCWRGFREETWWRRFREETWWRQTYLAVHLGRIVLLPENIKQSFVRDLVRVIFQLDSFCVACPATADLAVCWIYRLASCVTDCCLHIRKASKHTANDQFYCPFSIPMTTPPNAWNLGDKGKSSPTRYTKKEFCVLPRYEFFYLDDSRNALESQFDAPETSGCKCGLLLYHFHSPNKKIPKQNPCTTTSTTPLYTQNKQIFLFLSLVSEPQQPKSQSPKTQQRSHSPKLHQPAQKKTLAPRFPLYREVQDNSKSDNWNTYNLQKQGQIYTKCTERRDESRSKEKRRSSQEGEAKQQRERRKREIWERRVLFESSVAKERSRLSIIVGQQNVGQKKREWVVGNLIY